MDAVYTYLVSLFPNHKCDLSRITQEIHESSITIALDYINATDSVVNFYFKTELSVDEETTLGELVAVHTGEPLPEEPKIFKAEILTEHLEFVESGNTLNKFAATTLLIDISAGVSEKVTDFSWPIPVSLKSGTIGVSEDMLGDELVVHVAPNTLVGAITQPLNVGDTSIYVSPTVIENIKRGYYIGLYQPGDTGIEISQVISVDAANSCLQIHSSDVSANAGSYVAMCAKLVPYLYFHSLDKIELGKNIPTGQRIAPGISIRVIYKNNNSVAKKVSFFVEYLY
jgi:hypothetical protein